MKKLYLMFLLVLTVILAGNGTYSNAQVLNPADPIVIYNPAAPPAQPSYGQIGKWVITRDITYFNTDQFKSYIYKGVPFRLLYPHSYKPGVTDGKTYPLIIMFHGAGEKGTIYDNDLSLVHAGQNELNAENSGAIDAFVLHAQNSTGYWGPSQYGPISELITYMTANAKLDPYRIGIHGLSAGGIACWDFLGDYPKLVAASSAQSAADPAFTNSLNLYKYTPLWYSQGGLDQQPMPSTGNQMVTTIRNSGANILYLYFPNDGHNTWDDTYANPGFFPFLTMTSKLNPIVFFQKSGFCPGNPVNAKLGVTAGFDGYKWQKNGVLLPTATTNELMVSDTGYYAVSIKNGTVWSPFSPQPVHIYVQPTLPAPAIQLSRSESRVFPSLDSSGNVGLTVPGSFLHYAWSATGSSTIVDTNRIFKARVAGTYQVSVTLQNGCNSLNSPAFTIAPSPGTNSPSPATNVMGMALNFTTVKLLWSRNPNPAFKETGFEIYRSKISGGPYAFAGITPTDSLSFIDKGLNPNSRYFYLVRAVNTTGASAATKEMSVLTQVDNQAPTAPANLSIASFSSTSLNIVWNKSTDNVGVYQYLIFVNGNKSFVVDSNTTTLALNNLNSQTEYTIVVKAVDLSGNISPASNQVTGFTTDKGLTYKYYTFSTTPAVLPNFNALTPQLSGNIHNTDISGASQTTNFGYLFSGTLFIPVAGNYTIGTASDDGSRVYLDAPYDANATPFVNNDGSHGVVNVESTKYLTQGPHKIIVTYFQGGGGYSLQLYFKNTPITGLVAQQSIPDSFFVSKDKVPSTQPVAPSNLAATGISYKQINLSWTLPVDTTHTLTGFEIVRASSAGGQPVTIASLGATVNTYSDSTGLSPSSTYSYQIRSIGTFGQSAYTPASGLLQQYYTSTVAWPNNNLPDFNSLSAVSTVRTNNISIASATQPNNFAFKWSGTINIPQAGTYTFGTTSDDGSKLYIDQPYSFAAVPLVNNDGPHGANSAEGTITLTKGKHTFIATYDQLGGGSSMFAYVKMTVGGVVTKVAIPDSSFGNNLQARTRALPPLASAPGAISIKNISGTKLQVNFTDTTTLATSYQIYRSVSNTSSFTSLASIPATKLQSYSYTDTSLFAGVTYYYEVRAVNVAGPGMFSAIASATTFVSAPLLGRIANIIAPYGFKKQVQISSSDPQGLKVALSGTNLPVFASLVDYGDGTGLLTVNPVKSNLGIYPKVIITASNGKASASDTLSITVNSTFPPSIDSIAGRTLAATDSTVINLHATDSSARKVVFTTSALPPFIQLVTTGAFTAVLKVHPGLNDAGTYPLTVTATDSLGGTATRSFSILVNPYSNSQQISINFNGASNTNAPAPFNNTTGSPAQNQLYSALLNSLGKTTAIGFKVISNWAAIANLGHGSPGADYGPTTGNNSGVYPDLVEQSCWWTDTTPETIQFFGLQAQHIYDFTIYGGTKFSGINFISTFKIGSVSASLDATTNTTHTVSIKGQMADSSGHLSLTVSNNAGGFAYLNALVLNDTYQPAGVPAAPTNLVASFVPAGVSLKWMDNAVNETAYQVLRKRSVDSTFSIINSKLAANSSVYTDSTAMARTIYNYEVRAVNGATLSPVSNISTVSVGVKAPFLSFIPSISLKTDSIFKLSVQVTDDSLSLQQVKLTASGLPGSATFTDFGKGKGLLSFTPHSADIGTYSVTITATDANNLAASRTFAISVQDKNILTTYINFNQSVQDAAGLPFNNSNSPAYAGFSLNSLLDEYGNPSAVKLSFINAWSGIVDLGVQTGNNSGVYPDAVLKGFYYSTLADTMRLQLSGLSKLKKYNVDVVASFANPNGPSIATYTIGKTNIVFDPNGNSSKLISFKGISVDSLGKLQLKITKLPSSTYAIINAMVVTSYTETGIPLSPAALVATASSSTTISLKWQDRSNEETGFYILRSTAAAGPFKVIDSVATNVTSYMNTALNPNSTYYYEVIARGTNGNSSSSNVVSSTTLIFLVRVNFNLNAADAAPAPYNNTNSLPTAKIVLPLNDETGNSTGVVMSFAKNFTDYNNLGAQTGNNSGAFPDVVLKGFYYSVYPDSAIILFSNLNVNNSYDLSALPSYTNYSGSTVYAVGKKSIQVDAYQNTSNLAVFTNIVPDVNGQIRLTVKGATGASFVFINGLTLGAHPYNAASNNLLALGNMFETAGFKTGSKLNAFDVFPNPFTDKITVNLFSKVDGFFNVSIYDYNGRQVFKEENQKLYAGAFMHHVLDLNTSALSTGLYILKVTSNVLPDQSMKIMRH